MLPLRNREVGEAGAASGAPPWPRFWDQLATHDQRPAIHHSDSGRTLNYSELNEMTRDGARQLASSSKQLICVLMDESIESILCYLAALRSGHAVAACGTGRDDGTVEPFLEHYRPDTVIWGQDEPQALGQAYCRSATLFGHHCVHTGSAGEDLDTRLALVLGTSGSTGGAKAVRLSYDNVAVNAVQIASRLRLVPEDRLALVLPLHYVYGLSVLHSALAAGAALVVGEKNPLRRTFWSGCATQGVTTLPLVPAHLQHLKGTTGTLASVPCLRRVTISGSRLDGRTSDWLLNEIDGRDVEVHSMYGMTEASGRIATLPPELFRQKPGAVGDAVRWGTLAILPAGEILYRGPNVMLGYACGRSDLGRGDELHGVLATGDLGHLDSDGHLHVTGRITRFCKILGIRLSLDDIEHQLSASGEVAATGDDERISIFHTANALEIERRVRAMARQARVPEHAFELTCVREIPRGANGKVQYGILQQQAAS